MDATVACGLRVVECAITPEGHGEAAGQKHARACAHHLDHTVRKPWPTLSNEASFGIEGHEVISRSRATLTIYLEHADSGVNEVHLSFAVDGDSRPRVCARDWCSEECRQEKAGDQPGLSA